MEGPRNVLLKWKQESVWRIEHNYYFILKQNNKNSLNVSICLHEGWEGCKVEELPAC